MYFNFLTIFLHLSCTCFLHLPVKWSVSLHFLSSSSQCFLDRMFPDCRYSSLFNISSSALVQRVLLFILRGLVLFMVSNSASTDIQKKSISNMHTSSGNAVNIKIYWNVYLCALLFSYGIRKGGSTCVLPSFHTLE